MKWALLRGKILCSSSSPLFGRELGGNPTLPLLLLAKRRSALCFTLWKERILLHISFKSCPSKDSRLTVGHQRPTMGMMIGLERPSWRDRGQNRHILEVLLLLSRAIGAHRDWLWISQHYSEPVQEHKEYSGTMATGAGSDQHSKLHSKPALQTST